MKTMKENWTCPDAQVQVFMAQEYIASCPEIIEGAELVATCADHIDHHFVVTTVTSQDIANATVDGTPIGDALYRNKKNGIWAYLGTIMKGHQVLGDPYNRGEFMNTTESDKWGTEEYITTESRTQWYCDCVF
jgi:hypothetical protein